MIYKYKETGNLYKVTGKAQLKDPTTRKWLPAVIYEQYKSLRADGNYVSYADEAKMTFVREQSDFYSKFEIYND